ncbi:deoxyhypusine synthase, putative [Entamoeba dispar SAW760]|uniref:Deoxyhypusine synthase, putative n=1 Tax=Entamoeba dispar (strain ATCC PRA-260 / SAW760) TaxID=370354 RepID=B0EMW9_ENTDS|nr:deoxyhypusine synthase, putative [Entamoeba dispar SAW760]EDR24093.1 deoxyhypusine synthase, putative [Entamoeba dispar SAW760]|eukprot:EDR24093.1 deoxyhypusine synthase, putative [Entamoeba dispar SAW760]
MSITGEEFAKVTSKVLGESKEYKGEPCIGYDFDNGVDFNKLMEKMKYTGFQALNLGLCIEQVNEMRKSHAKIFLGMSSNIVSSGLREVIHYLVKNKFVDAIVVTAGGIEEDFIKTMHPTLLGDFYFKGKELYPNGYNRIGNLILPNSNYCEFEDWMDPLLLECLKQQNEHGVHWTPSKLVHKMGESINNESSIYYWAAKNNIPVFSPAITDGSIGDMIFFFSYKNEGLVLDLVQDVIKIDEMAFNAEKVGCLLVGAGIAKHHILNAMKRRGGCDYCAMLSTSIECDASDAGSEVAADRTKGFFKPECKPAKVIGDATILLPLIVASTFAKKEETTK